MPSPDPDIVDSAILSLLLSRHPAPVHVEELDRAFAGDDWRSSVHMLIADGLVMREGALHYASRAAVRHEQLSG